MLQNIINSTGMPVLSAFLLGLMTIISPCPFCSNITALGYISKDMSSPRRVLLNGTMYACGKVITYLVLSVFFILGAQIESIQHFFEHWGEPVLGPFLIVCGLFMLIGGKHESHHEHEHNHGLQQRMSTLGAKQSNIPSWLWSMVLGILFSLAFCPYSGVMYFGVLIPLTMSQPITWSWLMPVMFGIGTGLPVIIIAYLLSFSMVGMGKINQRIKHFEVWLRVICSLLFIIMGIWICVTVFGGMHQH